MARRRTVLASKPKPRGLDPARGSGARFRCCGRYCYWRLPMGPWACTQCDRRFEGAMPRSAYARFDDYIERLRAEVDALPPADPALLALFFDD